MRRNSRLTAIVGFAAAAILLVAGGLLLWGSTYVHNTVQSQLAEQQIYFPPQAAFAHPKAGTEITPSMIPLVSQYAGQQLLTGQQAEAYADHFIAVHLQEIGGGKTYSQLSEEAMALPKGSAEYTAAEAKVQTVFQGTTLRGLLLEAYGFSLIAEIAFWCAIAAFALAGIMAVLVGLGFAHARRTGEDEELLPSHAPHGALVSA